MAKRRKYKKKEQKQTKISVVLVLLLSILCSAYVLMALNDAFKLKIKYIPTLSEFKQTLFSKQLAPTNNDCEVHFIDVGQGDSIFLISDGKTILIDGGDNDKGDDVVDYIKKLGYKKIDLLMVTHPHSDHIGGLDTVINELDIGKIVMPKLPDKLVPTTRSYTDFLTAIANKGLKITPSKVGVSYEFGKGKIAILAPDGDFDDLNNNSLVVKFTYDEKSFLFTGDIESPAEKALLTKKFDFSADVLKIAHHGSNSSTTIEFYKAINPTYCVISVGDDNKYKHPNKETLETIKTNGAKVYRTDFQGSIVFIINEQKLDIKYEKQSDKK